MRLRPAVLPKFLCLSLLLFFGAIARGQMQPRVVSTVDNAKKATLAGNVHPLAKAEFDRGAVADAQPMNRILLLLKRSDTQEAALADALEKQQDKSSANYHNWLTPEQFGALYGPADSDIQAVVQWLTSQGFTVAKVYAGKTVIEFSGTAGQVRAAFGTDIRNYQVSGKNYVANASDPQIPVALAPMIAGIVSMNNFPRTFHARKLGFVRKVAGKPGLQPLFTYPFGSGELYGLGPGDFATIYNSKGLIGGTGGTIAIVGETNINVQDVTDFRTIFGLPATFSASNVILNGEDPGITSTGEEGEADLDVQWSGAVAPGATVNLVVSASTASSAGIDLSALYIIEHNMADVMSESYGSCEAGLGTAGNAFYKSLWQQAAAQGITVVVSSGDGGSAGCDDFNTETMATKGLAVSGIASTPYNVSVGGTDFDQANRWTRYWSTSNAPVTETSALSYIPEIPWNQNCAQISLTGCGSAPPNGSVNIVAGSGGPSNTYAKPSWQMGVTGMPNDNHRDQPDVSLFASPGFNGTGYLICQQDGSGRCNSGGSPNTYALEVIGGTSASAPSFAGVMALVNQYQAAHGGSGRQGNANYTLYALAKKTGLSCMSSTTEAATCVFNDVTAGNSELPTGTAGVGTNSVPCQGGTPNCNSPSMGVTGVLVDPSHTTTEAWTVNAGYDMVTGLGSMNVNNLATNWGTVSTVSTTTTLTLTPATGITHGTSENVSVSISVTPKSGTATGDVSLIAKFADGTTQGLDQFTLANGSFSGKTQSLPGGTNYSVYAHYAGDGVNAPSDSTAVTVSVGQEGSKTFIVVPLYDIQTGSLLSGNASSVPYGSPYRIRMYVTNSSGTANPTGPPTPTCDQVNELTCPTGTITLTANGTGVDRVNGVYSLDNVGYTRDINPTLGGGSYALVAQYSGDNSYAAGQPSTDSLTVTPATTTTTMNAVQSVTLGSPLNVGASTQANSLGVAPTGTYTIYDNGTAAPTAQGTPIGQSGASNGIASLQETLGITFTTAGTHSITTQYNGDANYAASSSSAMTVKVLNSTTTALTASSTNIIWGNSITLTAIVDTNVKSPVPTGTIQFFGSYDGLFSGTVSYQNITDATGNAALQATLVVTPKASENINVIYPGDGAFASSSGPNVPLFITVTVPDFNVTPGQFNVAVTAGQPSNTTVTVTPVTNLPSQVQLSVQNPFLVGVSCGVTPSTVSLSNQQAATAMLNCNVSAPSSSTTVTSELMPPLSGPGFWANRDSWRVSAVATLLGVILFLLPLRLRVRRFSYACFTVGLVGLMIGCGGGSGTGGGGGGGGGNGPTATSLSFSIASTKFPEQTTVSFTVSVTGTQSPTGTVSINNVTTGGNFGYVTLANGQATGQLSIDAPGAFSVTAVYSGDAKNLPSQTKSALVLVATGSANSLSLAAATGTDAKNYPIALAVQ